jgi:uncharacterized membrane protein YphA (DoxX/SURF4 family)
MKNTAASPADWRNSATDLGLFIFRLHLGVIMVLSGEPKLGGSEWFTNQVAELGFTWPTPVLWAWLAAWGEFVGGFLLILGLATRWAAAQLAFQFFVIAFLWYGEPDFFTGVYVQQELFWSFVLLRATGPGRWSVDGWLRGRTWSSLLRKKLAAKPAALAGSAAVLVVLAVCTAAGWSASHLHSDLTIAPGKQFVLGGGQRGAFKVLAKNKGTVPVEIKEKPRGGGIFGKATLKPGQQGVLRFAAGSGAVLLNPSAVPARLDLKVTGDTGALRMDSEPVAAAPGAEAAPRPTPPTLPRR